MPPLASRGPRRPAAARTPGRSGRERVEHQQGRDLCSGEGLAEEIALDLVTAVVVQEVELVLGLDALGDDVEVEGLGEGDDADGQG